LLPEAAFLFLMFLLFLLLSKAAFLFLLLLLRPKAVFLV
jgi:hypothetical protein